MLRKLTIVFLLLMVPAIAWGYCSEEPTEVEVIDDAGLRALMAANGYKYTFTADKVWRLDGRVFVQGPYDVNGDPAMPETLYVEPGTIIKGGRDIDNPSGQPSALIICRGGYAEMVGTAACPIIMTHVNDDVNTPETEEDGYALWGGLIILGASAVCGPDGDSWYFIEGIDPLEEPVRTRYGAGDDDAPENPLPDYPVVEEDHNSGIYQYISIRHGGFRLGDANEINGMTMGGLGYGTTIDHIEVFQNEDDGYEWFGGTVCCKYLVSAYQGDDFFDYDECFRGELQFLLAVHDDDDGDRTFETDGNHNDEEFNFSEPNVFNFTLLGPGELHPGTEVAFKWKESVGGHYNNGVVHNYLAVAAIDELGGTVEDPGACAAPFDSEFRVCMGQLTLASTMMWNIGIALPNTVTPPYPGSAYTAFGQTSTVGACFNGDVNWAAFYAFDQFTGCAAANAWTNNAIDDPLLTSVVGTYSDDQGAQTLDPRPTAGSPLLAGNGAVIVAPPATNPSGAPTCIEATAYWGAFAPGVPLWTDCWTYLSCGEFTPAPEAACYACGDANGDDIVNITDAVYLIQFIFNSGPTPCPYIAADSNCDEIVNITDAVYLIQYIFNGGPAPCADCP